MNKYDKKAEKIRQHLGTHPRDYQSVVSLFIAESDSIVYERKQERNRKMAEIARYRREAGAEQT